jgi:hypothetical protein
MSRMGETTIADPAYRMDVSWTVRVPALRLLAFSVGGICGGTREQTRTDRHGTPSSARYRLVSRDSQKRQAMPPRTGTTATNSSLPSAASIHRTSPKTVSRSVEWDMERATHQHASYVVGDAVGKSSFTFGRDWPAATPASANGPHRLRPSGANRSSAVPSNSVPPRNFVGLVRLAMCVRSKLPTIVKAWVGEKPAPTASCYLYRSRSDRRRRTARTTGRWQHPARPAMSGISDCESFAHKSLSREM